MENDLGEQHNLTESHPEITQRLLDAWSTWEADVNLHWTRLSSGVDTSIRGLDAVDEKVCWFGTVGGVARTVDAGASWQFTPIAESLDFRDIEAIDAQRCIAMSAGPGEASRLYQTLNGGATWQLTYQNDIAKGFFNGMAFRDDQHGILAGDPIDGRLFLLATDDGGASWHRIAKDTAPLMESGEHAFAASGTHLAVNRAGHVWVTSGGAVARVFRSTDWGKTWETTNTPMIAGKDSTGIFSITMSPSDAHTGIAVGGDYKEEATGTDNVIITKDGGNTWKIVKPNIERTPFPFLSSTRHIDPTTIIATGPSGTIVSQDAGETWQDLGRSPGYHTLSCVGRVIWAAGAQGRVGRMILPVSSIQ